MENSLIQARTHCDEPMIEDPPRLKVTVIAVLGYTDCMGCSHDHATATHPHLTFSGVKCRYGYAFLQGPSETAKNTCFGQNAKFTPSEADFRAEQPCGFNFQ